MSERGFPVHCPYCGERGPASARGRHTGRSDLLPPRVSWECRGCLRAFSLKMLGLVRPQATGQPTASGSGPDMTAATTRTARANRARDRDRGAHPRGAAGPRLALGRRAGARARPSTSSSGRRRPSATASASPRRWVTRCWRTWPPRSCPGVDVVFLDTGYHFVETIGTRDAVAGDPRRSTSSPSRPCSPRPSRTRTYGKDLYKTDPDLCCQLRKVQPLAEALSRATTPGRPACGAPRPTTGSSRR